MGDSLRLIVELIHAYDPKTMRAAAIDQFGGPEVLKLHTLPVPMPGPSEVLIEVDTARGRIMGR